MSLIWATRGRSWGFRFLLDGGYADPLPAYERAFAGHESDAAVFHRVGEGVALRFPDPLGRRDESGRVIPHDVVIPVPLAEEIGSVEDGLRVIWPMLADAFARVWDLPAAPGHHDITRPGD